MPSEQRELVESELRMLYEGNPPSVFTVGADALKAIPGNQELTLLELGCASGYYSEVISQLVGKRFLYTGADYSEPMLELAREKYPGFSFLQLDICNINLTDRAYDVVLSGAVIVHVEDWERAISELARVAGKYLILHRTPVIGGNFSRTEGLSYAGVPILFNTFNRDALLNSVKACGFQEIFEEDVYPDQPEGSKRTITYVFERMGS
jgi:SAM-dependent methyltransferase